MSDATLPPTEETPVQPMRWPPPGLGRIQGDLWLVARKMAVVAMVLVAPLLIVLVLPHSPYGLGPLGEAWWITLLTTFLGLALFTDAVVSLYRFVARVRRALAEGYTAHVVALVVSDRDRDNGFLLQGIKAFSGLADPERRTLGRLRFLAPLGYLVGATWFVVGFGLLLFLAARGAVSLTGVGFGTVGPAAFLWFSGLVLRATEGTIVYRAREGWHRVDWSEDLARHEIDAWQKGSEERGFVPAGASVRGAPTWPGVALVGVVVGEDGPGLQVGVGIVGFGGNGRRLAEVLAPFKTTIYATDCFPNDKPAIVENIVVPAPLFPDLDRRESLPNTLYSLYQREYGISIGVAREELRAVPASRREAQFLNLEEGGPVLQIDRVAIAIDGRLVERRLSCCDTREIVYSVDVR